MDTFQSSLPPRPLRLAYMTSISEIAGPQGGEFVGRNVYCPEAERELGYRMGQLESLVRGINKNRDGIGNLFQVVTVVHHDTHQQMQEMGFEGRQKKGATPWPWPENLPVIDGCTLSDVTHHVPMYTPEWRAARLSNDQNEAHRIRAEREQALSDLLDVDAVDLVLTDSQTYIFQGDMAMLKNVDKRQIINIHPAILEGETAIPGLYPTASALMRFNEGRILGPRRSVIDVPHLRGYSGHGATLHKTVAAIDFGEIIHAQEKKDMVQPGMTQQVLRHNVFELSRQVLHDGLIEFVSGRRRDLTTCFENRHALETGR